LVRPPGPAPGQQLTPQERAVLQLLHGSLSLRDIAAELHLSRNTVKTHTRAV
jgi:LuxR family maltose regulon positive regulatory protein